MHRLLRIAALAAILLGFLSTAAGADSVHLKGGSNSAPTFRDLGLALEVSGALAGLGNENLQVTLTADGNPTAVCVNPAVKNNKDNEPPGQNPAAVTLTGTQGIPASKIKNGNVSFDVKTNAPETPIPGAPDCPNHNWAEKITDVAFTDATITVEQPVGTTVLTVFCTFDPPTSNGPVPSDQVTCTS